MRDEQSLTFKRDVGGSTAALPGHFVPRECCPGCGSRRYTTLHRQSYLEARLWSFLCHYYGKPLSREWLEGAEYRLDQCLDCSLVFQRSIPNQQFLTVLYDDWLNSERHPDDSPADRDAMARPLGTRDAHEILTIARALGKDVADLRVLDYGMGWGLWSRVALRLGVRCVFGFDFSAARVEYARAHGIVTVTRSEITGLDLDFINADQVFEHMTAPREDAALLAGGLRKGGILKIAVPQAPGLRRRLRVMDWQAPRKGRNSLNPVHPLEHINCWSPRSLNVLGSALGLEAASPSTKDYLAFLGRTGSVHWADPRHVAKSLLRLAHNRWSRNNLYRWYRRT